MVQSTSMFDKDLIQPDAVCRLMRSFFSITKSRHIGNLPVLLCFVPLSKYLNCDL